MSRHAARRPPRSRRWALRSRRVGLAAVAMLLAVAAPAYSYWSVSSTGPGARAQAGTLASPTLSAGSVTATSAALSWTTPFTPTAYGLSQSPGTTVGCPATPATGSSACAATSLTPNTTYTWTLSARLHNWVSPASVSATTSKQATTTTLGNLTPTTGPVGTSFGAGAMVSGDAGYGTPAGTVTFSLYAGSTCTGAAAYVSAATPLSGGAAAATLQPGEGTYSWRATYTPTDTYNRPSTSGCSAVITVTPPGSILGFTYYSFWGTDYNEQGRPGGFVGNLALINSGGSAPQPLTSLTVTVSVPDTRAKGGTPSAVSGAGWTYQSVSHVASEWVYTFRWTGSLGVYGSTDTLGFTLPLKNAPSRSITSTATATNPYSNTATITQSGWL